MLGSVNENCACFSLVFVSENSKSHPLVPSVFVVPAWKIKLDKINPPNDLGSFKHAVSVN